MLNEDDNPWCVPTLEEFLHFCCPECDVKDKSKEAFLEHVSKKHPKATKFLTSWTSVKSELNPEFVNESRNFEDIKEECHEETIFETNGDNIDEWDNNFGKNLFTCLHCKESFQNFDILHEHMTLVHDKPENRPQCDTCGKIFKNENGLKKHIKENHQKKNEGNVHEGLNFSCERCGKKFNRKGNLEKHIDSIHLMKKCQCQLPQII